ncbi:MAG: hypothetical protein M1829_005439 [Trizodia sp. TS-e1964]|nr:MAG: hypothetical protein M1829_005439 [Trizodia sp. TS-e1964]
MAPEDKERVSGELSRPEPSSILPTVNPSLEKAEPPKKASLHSSVYVIVWITLSSSVILFNKWILHSLNFQYPIILTTWHLVFATCMTQILARTTTLLDGRKTVKMTGRVYLRAILPIGFFFSLSLICGNVAYLYLSVSFIQMLKATTPVAVLVAGWTLGVSAPDMKILFNVSFIVIGVMIASYGELRFNLTGFIYQVGGIGFEAVRLVMVQQLLSSAEYKMDPLVSLYYFAPVCAAMNFVLSLLFEASRVKLVDFQNVGLLVFVANAMVAFGLNVSVVFLIGKTSGLVLTLCGVLKDILLIVASMAIFGSIISSLQFFGYAIALGGLIYYKLGSDKLKDVIGEGSRAWGEYGARRPAMRKAIIIFTGLTVLIILLGGLSPFLPENMRAKHVFSGSYFSFSSVGDKVMGGPSKST